MLNLKKQVSFYKLEQILAKSKLLLCCHCNNMNTLEWSLLKKELSKLNLLKGVNTLLVKNKIAKKLLNQLSFTSAENLKNPKLGFTACETKEQILLIPKLFQGPTFIIGCQEEDLVVPLVKLINKNNKLLVVGGVLQKKIINHLDINLLKKLDKSIFNELVNILERPIVNFFSINQKHTTEILLLLIAKQKSFSEVNSLRSNLALTK